MLLEVFAVSRSLPDEDLNDASEHVTATSLNIYRILWSPNTPTNGKCLNVDFTISFSLFYFLFSITISRNFKAGCLIQKRSRHKLVDWS
jgi:hypothetical protein